MSAVAALILAAGRGTRFGASPKLLAEIDGEPLVRRVARTALTSRAQPVIVVVGHEAGRIEEALRGLAVSLVANRDYADGLSTSLRAGFAALPEPSEGALVMLGDMPRVSPATLDALIDAFAGAPGAPAVVPLLGRRRGNPVLLSRRLASSIATLTGDRGAGPLLSSLPGVVEVPVADLGILADVDRPADLDALAGA